MFVSVGGGVPDGIGSDEPRGAPGGHESPGSRGMGHPATAEAQVSSNLFFKLYAKREVQLPFIEIPLKRPYRI